MKLPAAITIAASAGSAAILAATGTGAAATAHASSALAPCVPKIGTSGGKPEIGYCGPATATLVVGGKTYSFKDGFCNADTKAGDKLGLTLGTLDDGNTKTNGGQPLFELSIIASDGIKINTVNAFSGGKSLVSLDTVNTKWTGSTPSSGTFTSASSVINTGTKFSGTWNCHGPVYST